MAKSTIIKELATDICSLEIALNRLYLISLSIQDTETAKWVKNELEGYKNKAEIPSYRNVRARLAGTFQIVGYGKVWTHSHTDLPCLDEELNKSLTTIELDINIKTIIETIDKSSLMVPIDMSIYPLLEEGTNIHITQAYREITQVTLQNITQTVKNKVIDILICLENEFGNLDSLDIDISSHNSKQISKVYESCFNIIFDNATIYSIQKSKVKNSNIGKNNKNEKVVTTEISPQITINKGEEENKKVSFLKRIFCRRK